MKLQRTREWREAAGLTQRELSKESGVGKGTIVRIENGESATPRTAKKIADTLNISVADLLESPPVPLGQAQTSYKPPEEAQEKELREELLEEERGAYEEQRHTADEVEEVGPARITKAKREHIQSAAIDADIMSLYRWADEAKKQFETLKSPGREDYKLEDLRSFYTSFIDRLRNYQRYMYKPLRDLCVEQRQRDSLEHVEKRLRDLRDETRKFFQDRLEIKRLYDKLPPQDRHEFERLAQDLTQDREQQAAGIEGMSPTVGESAG